MVGYIRMLTRNHLRGLQLALPEEIEDEDIELIPAISKKKGPEETTVGLDDEILKLKERLLWGNQKLEIVSIVGMPGLGKTTLATRLYNDPLIMYEFPLRAWAYVSQPYDKRTLLLQILSSVLELTHEVKEMGDNKLEELLKRGLSGNKYLIILDDIWSVEPWNYLKRSLPNDIYGSKIIFTSRVKNIAKQAQCYSHSYSLRHLTEEESWTLLQRKIFQDESCPLNLAEVGHKIAARCQGLPLALVLIAGVLTDNASIKWWEQVAEEVGSFMLSKPNQYMQTLELSYRTLPDHLKSCFLYFGVFPQDYEVPARKLCLLWVSGGVIDQTVGNNKSEEMAEGYLMDLVNRSLISVASNKSNGGIKSCRVHDLLHDLCVRKAKEEGFSNSIVGSRELSLVPFSEPVIPFFARIFSCFARTEPVMSKQQQPTHSLGILDMADSSNSHPCSILYFTAETCPFLMDSSPLRQGTFSLLEMLDFSSVRFMCFPVEVVCLVHLKYLALQADNGSLPTSISKLQCLETLIVSSKSHIALPKDIWKIRTLRHLYAKSGKNVIEDPMFPKRSANNVDCHVLDNLQTLSVIYPSRSCKEVLSRAPNLKKLGFCGILVLSNHIEFPDLGISKSLETLKLLNTATVSSTEICNPFEKFPEGLKKLTLSNTGLSWEQMRKIGWLPNLEILKLKFNACVGNCWNTHGDGFSQLKYLMLQDLDLETWETSRTDFPRLQNLVVHQCPDLQEIPSDLGYISTLELIEIRWCNSQLVESVLEIKEEQKADGNDELNILISDRRS